MSKKDEIKRLWGDTFDDSPEFVAMYFDRVYRDADAMTVTDDAGHIVSSLLLLPYGMTFHGLDATASYIAGAATRRNMRGRGLMTSLMTDALHASRDRGDIITLLIPASGYLYGYYSRFGFSTVIFTDIERYTALHAFIPADDEDLPTFTPVDDLFSPAVYDAVARFERGLKQSTILHSRRDFLNILDDLRLDEGYCSAVADGSGRVAAIAWGRPAPDGTDTIRVDEVLSASPEARNTALRALRDHWPERPMAVMAIVDDNGRKPTPRGMARIVSSQAVLDLLARAYPDLKLTLRITDPILTANSGVFRIRRGSVETLPSPPPRLDFDIDIATFTDLIFSSPAIGDVTCLPARRLHASMLLD